jgi:hypothetical protein
MNKPEPVVLVPVRGNAVGLALGGVSRSQVYRLMERGDLLRVNIGRRAFVPMSSIQAYLARITAAASA